MNAQAAVAAVVAATAAHGICGGYWGGGGGSSSGRGGRSNLESPGKQAMRQTTISTTMHAWPPTRLNSFLGPRQSGAKKSMTLKISDEGRSGRG